MRSEVHFDGWFMYKHTQCRKEIVTGKAVHWSYQARRGEVSVHSVSTVPIIYLCLVIQVNELYFSEHTEVKFSPFDT